MSLRCEYVVVRMEDGEPAFFNFEMMPLPQAEEIAILLEQAFNRQYGVINMYTFLEWMEEQR